MRKNSPTCRQSFDIPRYRWIFAKSLTRSPHRERNRETTRLTNAFSTVVVRWSSRKAICVQRGGARRRRRGGEGRGVAAREQLSWDSWQGKRAPGTFEKSMALITKCRYLGRLQSLLYPRPWVVDVTFVEKPSFFFFFKHIFPYFDQTSGRGVFSKIFFELISYSVYPLHLKFISYRYLYSSSNII